MTRLEVQSLYKSFPNSHNSNERIRVLEDINLTVEPEEIVAIIGPSGCGKTSFLRIVAGLLPSDRGQCLLGGKPVTRPRPDIGIVFQMFNLLPWRTALSNVEFGLELQRVPADERHDRARHYLELVGLDDFANHRPYQLSGGMQQRVGLARALALDPALLLMDEPFGALDHQTAERLRDELLKIQAKTHKMILIITHNIDEAIYLSDRVVVLSPRPGKIVWEISTDLPEPRWEHDIYSMPRFGEIRSELRHLLIGG